jgi:hypothetical protein
MKEMMAIIETRDAFWIAAGLRRFFDGPLKIESQQTPAPTLTGSRKISRFPNHSGHLHMLRSGGRFGVSESRRFARCIWGHGGGPQSFSSRIKPFPPSFENNFCRASPNPLPFDFDRTIRHPF